MFKAVAKLNTWAGFLPESINDPLGAITAKAITSGIGAPTAFTTGFTVSLIGALLLSVALYFSIREMKIVDKFSVSGLIPKLFLYTLYMAIVLGPIFSNG